MANIKDIIKEIEFRIKNPLIASFLVAWLVTNWEVVLGIASYSQDQLAVDGYNSKIDLVNQRYSPWHFLWKPLSIALFYVLVFPVIRHILNFIRAWINRWGDQKTLQIMKNGTISVSKYISLKNEYEERTMALMELIDKESGLIRLNSELNRKIEQIEQEKSLHMKTFFELQTNSKLDQFRGYWEIMILNQEKFSEQKKVLISDKSIYHSKAGEHSEKLFTIMYYGYNSGTGEFLFILKDEKTDRVLFQALAPISHGNFRTLKNVQKDGLIQFMEKELLLT